MLKIKIPPRSEPEKTDAVPLKTESEDSDLLKGFYTELIDAKWFDSNEILDIELVKSVKSLFKKLKLFEKK